LRPATRTTRSRIVVQGSTTVERAVEGKVEKVEYKEGSVHVTPTGMSMTKKLGKGEVTIYTVTVK
jgi:hypothetical protein